MGGVWIRGISLRWNCALPVFILLSSSFIHVSSCSPCLRTVFALSWLPLLLAYCPTYIMSQLIFRKPFCCNENSPKYLCHSFFLRISLFILCQVSWLCGESSKWAWRGRESTHLASHVRHYWYGQHLMLEVKKSFITSMEFFQVSC